MHKTNRKLNYNREVKQQKNMYKLNKEQLLEVSRTIAQSVESNTKQTPKTP